MEKILIVDDMEVNREIAEMILSSKYQTMTAASGEEAMEIYRKERPDMVLSDVRMPPGMSGYELQRDLQEEYHTAIPFMFVTANASEEAESEGFANGAMDFIRKPFKPDVLLRRVGNILMSVGHKKQARTDLLTGLLNKASSEKEVSMACQHLNGALMIIDLDSFKLVNDIYGHSMGDSVLVSFANIIQSAVRPSDLVGRLGGDEFIAFCQGLQDESGIAHKAEYINERLVESAKELMGEDMNIPLGASVGCVFVPSEGTDFPVLFKKADKALYTVKHEGKHGYRIYSEEHAANETEAVEVISLSNAEMILGERNQGEGAYLLPFEGFRTVYRFLKRTITNYGNLPVSILLLSLRQEKDTDMSMTEAGEQFLSVICSTLRKADAVTQNGSNQFLVLLSSTSDKHIHHVSARIDESWKQVPASEFYTFSCEGSLVKP